jgi:Dual specificity phosphatase, catalytic domain
MTPKSTAKRASSKRRTSRPSEISPGIFVGGWKDAEQFAGTRVCVLDERPEELDEMPGSSHLPIYDKKSDGPIVENLDRVAELVHEAHSRGEPALVFCGHGIRRGSLGGAWYLHRYEGLSLDRAFDQVEAARPEIERPAEWMGGWKALEGAPPPGRSSRGRGHA